MCEIALLEPACAFDPQANRYHHLGSFLASFADEKLCHMAWVLQVLLRFCRDIEGSNPDSLEASLIPVMTRSNARTSEAIINLIVQRLDCSPISGHLVRRNHVISTFFPGT